MNYTIDTSELDKLKRRFEQFSDTRFQSGLADALNGVARDVRDTWAGQLRLTVDRPTAPTKDAPVVTKKADVGALVAEVGLRSTTRGGAAMHVPPSEYLATQERGASDRRQKKFEVALQRAGAMPSGHKVVPGKHAQLDGFGNISRRQIVQVLNQLAGGVLDKGYRQVVSANAGKRKVRAAKAGRQYVAILARTKGIEPGVYQRGDRGLLPVFFYVPRTRYGRRTNLTEAARWTIEKSMGQRIGAAMQRKMHTLLARG